jgi:hypothetical protein
MSIFFCCVFECAKIVKMSGTACEDHRMAECLGCGGEMYVGANGYCVPCWTEQFGSDGCPACGVVGATVLGSDYCHKCHPKSDKPAADGWCPNCEAVTVVLPNCCRECQQRIDDAAEYAVWCEPWEPNCTCATDLGTPCSRCTSLDRLDQFPWPQKCECDNSGRMCDSCSEEYKEQCRGCGSYEHLWTDNTYCRECYVKNYGDEFPSAPRHTSLQSMRDEIAEIEERLKTNMTKHQKDDWIWLLQNRRGDLAAAEKEMWAGYDADDLRKLDLQLRR